jgi:hypothetical protein
MALASLIECDASIEDRGHHRLEFVAIEPPQRGKAESCQAALGFVAAQPDRLRRKGVASL